MVRKLAIIGLLCMSAAASASESGVLAGRAQRSINAGKFAKAYNQLERALLASRKEADLLSEGRVLLAMAQIRTQSLDLDFADSLISVVRPEVLDITTAANFTRAKVALANARENYADGAKLCNKADPDSIKKTDKGHPEVCVAFKFQKLFNAGEAEQIEKDCREGCIGCVACKKRLAEKMVDAMADMHVRRQEYQGKPEKIREILEEGAKKARVIAGKTMEEVREVMHLA